MQQGNGDAYHMYPFFTGLCGYIFGRNAAGNLDPSDIGVANPKFLKVGAPEIDRWNKVGLINSSVTDGIAKQLFLTGKAAYYVTGPWFLDDIKKSGVKFAVSAFPNNKCTTTPFTGVGGLMVTKFAADARRRVAREGLRRQLHAAGAGRSTRTTRSVDACRPT